ncbi:MAG: FAD-dependent oxidoreductase [Bacteroidales bacterium]
MTLLTDINYYNTDLLNTESAGIEVSESGFIRVNDFPETNVPGIYALGDCNGQGAYTHSAYNDYEIVAEIIFEVQKRNVSDRITTYSELIPTMLESLKPL